MISERQAENEQIGVPRRPERSVRAPQRSGGAASLNAQSLDPDLNQRLAAVHRRGTRIERRTVTRPDIAGEALKAWTVFRPGRTPLVSPNRGRVGEPTNPGRLRAPADLGA